MTLAESAMAVGLWAIVVIAVYAGVSYVLLFYLPPADRLANGTIADTVFVTTLPLVLALTWIAAVRNRG